MQPTFNPWLGYFDLIDYVDKFIFLDIVQLVRRSWQVRNKIKINGKEYFLTLPIKKLKTRDEEIIYEAIIDDHLNIKKKFLNTLNTYYKKSKFYSEVHPFISSLILYETQYLSEYNINLITNISKKLNIKTEFIILSKTSFKSIHKKGELILDICKFFDATAYISPIGSKTYLDNYLKEFKKNNIPVYYQNYNHPFYNQIGNNFISYLGIIDLLYNEGFENSKKIIISGRNYKRAYL